jgi:hypothetical protein
MTLSSEFPDLDIPKVSGLVQDPSIGVKLLMAMTTG